LNEPRQSLRATNRYWLLPIATLVAILVMAMGAPAASAAPCDPPVTNEIACENSKPGSPESEWDISGEGDPSIQGFATDISVNQGQTVHFKINSVTNLYRLDIYRMGYYGGLGARKVDTVTPLSAVPTQPACLGQPSTGLIDCGNWAESASWNVPADAVSGVYIAKLVRLDEGGASHIIFVVRDDDGGSDMLFQTADTTWQAYNRFGGNSLYTAGGPVGRAFKVSYNRPFSTRAYAPEDWFFNAEYPMVRFLERNGYDVSYFTDVDSDRRGAEIREHRSFLSVGHDEYWSGAQRANVEAARAAGVHLGFFTGNEVFWKTRWEASTDGSATPYRTLVSYKETHAGAKIDPEPGVWTGTWRDPRFSPPADGGRPENALTGQLFAVNDGATTAIQVPAADGKMRFWRNTSVASLAAGEVATLTDGTLGYEWDLDADNGHRPAGSFRLSSTTVQNAPVLTDHGSSYSPRDATHNMTLYRHAGGALVFGSGTVQWPWGLDGVHDRGQTTPDPSMQQATVNLFADMGVQPAQLQPGLQPATQSTDTTPPTSAITSPAGGTEFEVGTPITITGTASDTGGGTVGGVEVSLDGGSTWRRADGRSNWSYTWTPASPDSLTIRSRAVDDSGRIESPAAGRSITVVRRCCTIWSDSVTPSVPASGDTNPVELGVKFRATLDGRVTGLRFYKGAGNEGPHTGHLWTAGGTLLASVTFTGESAVGWQQMNLSQPVGIAAGTTYIASYHTNGRYAIDRGYFETSGVDNEPLRALREGEDGGNGVFMYGPSGSFPSNSFNSSNYWVDVVFEQTGDTTAPTVTSTSPVDGANPVIPGSNIRATFSEAMDAPTVSGSSLILRGPGGASVPASVSYNPSTRTATLDPTVELAATTTYTATVKGGTNGVRDSAHNVLAADHTWSFTTGTSLSANCPCTIWSPSDAPTTVSVSDGESIEVGTKFRADADGKITALRFYKGAINGGTHVGHLWTSGGFMLAEATFAGETSEGWQEAILSEPVSISAGSTYIVSYHAPFGSYAADANYFASSGVDSGPLRALQDGESGGNGVYAYGNSGTFPSNSFNAANYWVDVVFEQNGSPDIRPPVTTSVSPMDGTTAVGLMANVRASFNELLDPASVSGSSFELRGPGGAIVAANVSYNATTRTATLNPNQPLAASTSYTATLKGGPSGLKDRAGNPIASDQSWSFTTAADATGDCPCTIWSDSATPGNAGADDSSPVEIGVKFRPKVDGQITGVRFYKGTANNGGHVGHLWTAGGSMLAAATFKNESPSGWQQVIFSQPVSVNAGTTYVASYHTKVGSYAYDPGYFANSGVDNGPLRALRRGDDGGNGVFGYGPSGTFPSREFGAANYWVDVIFEYEPGGGADSKPPRVTMSPPDGATDVGHSSVVRATFNEAMDGSTINGSTMQLRTAGGSLVSATVSYSASTRTATLTPRQPLFESATYTATVTGGANGVKDSAGNPLAGDSTSSFTTAAPPPPPPDDGPGGPILVITKSTNAFTRYYAEILRAEGLNEFATRDISTVTPATLGAYDVVILGNMSLTSAQVGMLTNWVNLGGNLIAMRPDEQLAGLLGLVDSSSVLPDAYLKVDASRAPGTGIVNETVQFHGTADRYATNGASTVATLYASSTLSTPSPAVTVRDVGTNGGQAAAFTFDLARSIVYSRQGNPEWDSHERDGAAPTRSNDLFFGGALGDLQPDWIDLSKVEIPQADELQRLLANLIGHVNADRKPLPRFWYLPRDEKAAVIMTGDDHGNNGTQGRFETHKAISPVGCSVEQWECIRSTSYIYPATPITDAAAAQYTAEGFEIAVHFTTSCNDYTQASLDTVFTDQLVPFRTRFPSLADPVTNRTHCVVWSDWASQPKVELQHGVRLDTTYYYWPSSWITNRPGMFTGSGMPMRFADKDGTMIDVYQAPTQMTDESGQAYPFTADVLLDNAIGPKGYYGAFTANMHTDAANLTESDAIIESAMSRGVPVVSARQMLQWLDGRNGSAFRSIAWANNTLSFTIDPAAGATGLRAMLPASGGRQVGAISRDGTQVAFDRRTIKGVEYAIFDAVAGNYTASYAGVPTASFTATPNPVQTGSLVSFNASGSSDVDGTITRYEWDLDGNGSYETNTGTNATTSRTYTTPGSVTVGLRVTDDEGQPGTTTRSVTVTNRTPTASFTGTPNPANVGQSVAFNAGASSDPDGTIARYEWDLDGNGSFETDTGAAATTSRTYTTAGTVNVNLRVTDNTGGTGTTTRAITITSGAPTASFTVAPNPATTRQSVTFDGAASSVPGGTITRYEWDLDGNGSFETDTGATATTSRVYDTVGTINVGLRVTGNGNTATTTRTLTTNSAYQAAVLGTAGVNGYWRLAETGTSAVSLVGTNTGAFTNGPLSTTGALIAGEQNRARNFDGVNDYVNLAPGPVGTPAAVSAEAWVRTESTKGAGGYHFLVTHANIDFDDGFSLAIDDQNRAVFAVGGRNVLGGVVRGSAVSSVSLAPNTTHHVVGTFGGGQLRIYVDGVERGSAPFANGIFYRTGRDFWFARQRNTTNRAIRHLDGTLDEVAVYSTALPAATVQAHYAAGAP
jgi:PKD repeat protein